jgi:hypothetical protein
MLHRAKGSRNVNCLNHKLIEVVFRNLLVVSTSRNVYLMSVGHINLLTQRKEIIYIYSEIIIQFVVRTYYFIMLKRVTHVCSSHHV